MKIRPLALVAAAAATLLALSACSAPADSDGPTLDGPTVTHAFGETQVPSDPQRVVTLGWGSSDAAVALGVVPVGMEAKAYGGDDEGVLPWIAEELENLGADTPTMITETTEAPAYDEILALEPDLILAVYSGIDEEQYELLSDIAPTVAYPDAPWTTDWREVIEIVGDSLSRSDEAAAVLEGIDAEIATAAEEHPEFEGKTVASIWDVSGTFYVYRSADPRVSFLFGLGFENAPAVDELASGESSFYYTLSYEQLDQLESDIVVNFADTDEAAEAFLAQSYAQVIPAVKTGGVANVTGTQTIAAVSPPTALSLSWGLDDYIAALSTAVDAIG